MITDELYEEVPTLYDRYKNSTSHAIVRVHVYTTYITYTHKWRAGASQPSRSTGTILYYVTNHVTGVVTYCNVQRNSK